MEMESRRREPEQKRRKRKREWKRLVLGGILFVLFSAAVGTWMVRTNMDENRKQMETSLPESSKAVIREIEDGLSDGKQDETSDRNEEAVAIRLPSRYDLRELGAAPAVPDQGTFGTCWAFASLGALESSMPVELRTSLSADHMSLQNRFGLSQNDGGDYSIATSYLLAWQGPVAESDDPYGDGYSPDDLEPVCHVQEYQMVREKNLDAIKDAVRSYGGVQSSFYMPQTDGTERSRYYNEETHAFYYDGNLAANHDVVIIGWEDQYPKENFIKEPEEDGAFLCMNTWGESFGDRGYFYISYEDSRIGCVNVVYTGIASVENYDSIYQTDLCGWTGQLGYGNEKAWFANIYEAEEDSEIAAAGFYATVENTAYRVYVLDSEAAADVSEAAMHSKRVLAAEGLVNNAGYYTIPLEAPVEVKTGDRFGIIVEIESAGAAEPVAVECMVNERTQKVEIRDGEGYISPDGIVWQRAETELQCNVCLKAYGKRKNNGYRG